MPRGNLVSDYERGHRGLSYISALWELNEQHRFHKCGSLTSDYVLDTMPSGPFKDLKREEDLSDLLA